MKSSKNSNNYPDQERSLSSILPSIPGQSTTTSAGNEPPYPPEPSDSMMLDHTSSPSSSSASPASGFPDPNSSGTSSAMHTPRSAETAATTPDVGGMETTGAQGAGNADGYDGYKMNSRLDSDILMQDSKTRPGSGSLDGLAAACSEHSQYWENAYPQLASSTREFHRAEDEGNGFSSVSTAESRLTSNSMDSELRRADTGTSNGPRPSIWDKYALSEPVYRHNPNLYKQNSTSAGLGSGTGPLRTRPSLPGIRHIYSQLPASVGKSSYALDANHQSLADSIREHNAFLKPTPNTTAPSFSMPGFKEVGQMRENPSLPAFKDTFLSPPRCKEPSTTGFSAAPLAEAPSFPDASSIQPTLPHSPSVHSHSVQPVPGLQRNFHRPETNPGVPQSVHLSTSSPEVQADPYWGHFSSPRADSQISGSNTSPHLNVHQPAPQQHPAQFQIPPPLAQAQIPPLPPLYKTETSTRPCGGSLECYPSSLLCTHCNNISEEKCNGCNLRLCHAESCSMRVFTVFSLPSAGRPTPAHIPVTVRPRLPAPPPPDTTAPKEATSSPPTTPTPPTPAPPQALCTGALYASAAKYPILCETCQKPLVSECSAANCMFGLCSNILCEENLVEHRKILRVEGEGKEKVYVHYPTLERVKRGGKRKAGEFGV